MKSQDGIREVLRKYKRTLKQRFKVKEIGVFGSFARGEGLQDSDVDILVEFSEPIGWEFIDLKEFLEEILGRQVHLTTPRMLRPSLKDTILEEVVYT